MKGCRTVQACTALVILLAGPLLARAQQQFAEPNTYWTQRTSPPNGTSIDVTYFIGGFNPAMANIIRQAASAWAAAGANVTITEVGGGGMVNFIGFPLGNAIPTDGNSRTTTGVLGTYPDGKDFKHITSDSQLVNIDLSVPWWLGAGPAPAGTFDFYAFMLRDFGLALGLGYANGGDPLSVMQQNIAAGPANRSLSPGDVAAAQLLYGTPEPSTWALFGVGLLALAAWWKGGIRTGVVS